MLDKGVRVDERKSDTPVALKPELIELGTDLDHVGLLQDADNFSRGSQNEVGIAGDVDCLGIWVHGERFDGYPFINLDNSII